MTRLKLNRAIKKLYKEYNNLSAIGTATSTEYWQKHDQFKKQFILLYREDTRGELLTLLSLKMMITLNHSLRAVPFHYFYIDMKF